MGFHTWRLWNKLDYFSIGTIYRRRETFEILNLYEAPPSQSNGSYILGNPFSFQSYSIVVFFFFRDDGGLLHDAYLHLVRQKAAN